MIVIDLVTSESGLLALHIIWRCQFGCRKVCDMEKAVLTEERLARIEAWNASFFIP